MALKYPYSEQSEMIVLGCALFDEQLALRVTSSLRDESYFYINNNKLVFKALKELSDKDLPMDIGSVATKLAEIDELDNIGGIDYLTELQNCALPANLDYHIDTLKDKKNLRDFVDFLQKTVNNFETDTAKYRVMDYFGNVEKEFTAISRQQKNGDFITIKDAAEKIRNKIVSGKKMYGENTTGYSLLDKYLLGGWQKENLYVIGARPGMGKTAFAINLAYNHALKTGKIVCFFSLEMSAEQITSRFLSCATFIAGDKINTLDLDKEEIGKIDAGVKKLSNLRILIDENGSVTPFEIVNKLRKLKADYGDDFQVAFIDYLGLIDVSKEKEAKNLSKPQQIGVITRTLKLATKELGISIVLLAQLNRGVANKTAKESKIPQLSDLKDSGDIEQDADVVMAIHSDSYYDPDGKKMDQWSVILPILKNRHGSSGNIKMVFNRSQNRFLQQD